MHDGLVYRSPRRAEIGELGLGALSLQDIGRRHCFAALLVGDRALDDRPVDATGRTLIGSVGNILKTAIDYRL
jgi:hypothetical protein